MAKFLRIGVHHSNVSGYTSKAWSVRRVGSTVLLKWGAVEVRGAGHGRRIYWASPPRQKTVSCDTEKRARDYVKNAISRRVGHQYERLLESVPIRRRPARHNVEVNRELATILFVDIVRSTEKAARLGDRRWSEVMNHYYASVRRELRAARGREVITTGDGMLATFEAAAEAIRCAAAIREAVRTLGLEIRAGLHTGEYELIGDEVVGIAIHIGARVAAKAGASEVLVSSTVRDLVSESGIGFKDRGVHKLKGVPERWRLYLLDLESSEKRRIEQRIIVSLAASHPDLTPAVINQARLGRGMARIFVNALQEWERGRVFPDRQTRILLRLIEKAPKTVERAVAAG